LYKSKNQLVKPFVKWAGGKRQLLPEISKYIPTGVKKYYEPFVGGGAVFLNMQFSRPVINDFNGELINTYLVVKNNPEQLVELLRKHQLNNSSEYYYEIRACRILLAHCRECLLTLYQHARGSSLLQDTH